MQAASPVAIMLFAVVVTVPPTLQSRVRCAVLAPIAEGVTRAVMVQLAEAARSAVPHVSPVMVKSAAFVPTKFAAVQPVAEAVPEFVNVKT